MAKVTRTSGPGRVLLSKAITDLGKRQAQVGWLASSKYPNGMPVAYDAAIHEFGYAPKNIPPRMGLREMVSERRGFYAKVAEQESRNIFRGTQTVDGALTVIGAVAEGDIRKQITRSDIEPLKESTLERRASNLGIPRDELTATGMKPLVEPVMSKANGGGSGGLLLATVTHTVAPEGSAE